MKHKIDTMPILDDCNQAVFFCHTCGFAHDAEIPLFAYYTGDYYYDDNRESGAGDLQRAT